MESTNQEDHFNHNHTVIGNKLSTNKTLEPGQCLKAPNHSYFLKLHQNGNLVLYSSTHHYITNVIWSTKTAGKGKGPHRLIIQEDGNSVLYDSDNKPTWASNTSQTGAQGHYLELQDEGDLVLYDGNGQSIWSSGTRKRDTTTEKSIGKTLENCAALEPGQCLKSQNHSYYAKFEEDGTLAVYNSSHHVPSNIIWSNRVDGRGKTPYQLEMQGDGNLVIYNCNRQCLWSTSTNNMGYSGHFLQMEDNGNLVVYDGNRKPVWSTNTARGKNVIGVLLESGQSLKSGQCLKSANHSYHAEVKDNGNLTIYGTFFHGWSRPIWSANIETQLKGPFTLKVQEDGELAVANEQNESVWSTKTSGSGAPGKYLKMRDDGSLILYDGNDEALWSSNSARGKGIVGDRLETNQVLYAGQAIKAENKPYYAKLREDGTFVIYNSPNHVSQNVVWESRSNGTHQAPYHIRMQEDGNLVVYDGETKPIWASDTYGNEGCQLHITDDGDVIIKNRHQNVLKVIR